MEAELTAVLNPLILRYGEGAVVRWLNILGYGQIAALNALGHLSNQKGAPLAADAIAIVLRIPSDHLDGTCAVVALGEPMGMMSTEDKVALLRRALESLEENDLLPLPPEAEAAYQAAKKAPALAVGESPEPKLDPGAAPPDGEATPDKATNGS